MLRLTLSVLFALVFSQHLAAQGFGIFNGRNHPNLVWKEAQTEHFRIIYPQHLDGVQHIAASIAEETHEKLTALFGVQPKRKLLIGLSDEDEISNGYAVPFGFTMLWVNVNDYAEIWTGNEKWLRKVIAHELAHLLHFEAIKTELPFLFDQIFNDTPREWYEGIAQYTTEKWDSERGDRWLRSLIYDDYNDINQSLYFGGAMYAKGNSQVRHFAQTYGDSALTKLLTYRKKGLLNLDKFKSYSFTEGFKDVTGQSFEDFERSWWKHVQIYYNTLAGQMDRLDSLNTKPVELPGTFIRGFRVTPSGKHIALASYESLERPTLELLWLSAQQDKEDSTQTVYKKKRLAYGPIGAQLSISADEQWVAYQQVTRSSNGNLFPDVYRVHVKSGKKERITVGKRASHPVFGPTSDEIAYVVNQRGTTNIFMYSVSSKKESPVTHFEGDVQITGLAWNHQRNELAYAIFDDNAERMLIVRDMNTGQQRVIDDSLADNRMPVFSPDGKKLMFTSLRDHVPNVFIHDLETHETERATWLFNGAYGFGWSEADEKHPGGKLWLKATERFTEDGVRTMDAAKRATPNSLFMNPSFSAWTTKLPPDTISYKPEPRPDLVRAEKRYSPLRDTRLLFGFVLPYVDVRDHLGLSMMGLASDPLGKHQFLASADFSFYDSRFSTASFLYTNNTLKPSLNFFYSTNLFGLPYFYDGQLLTNNNRHVGGVLASLPLDFISTAYTYSTFNFRLRTSEFVPVDFWEFKELAPGTNAAQRGSLNDVRVSFTMGQAFPDKNLFIAPREGYGVRIAATKAIPELGSTLDFLQTDISTYTIFSLFGKSSLYVYGRAQSISGNRLNQFFVGFNRLDDPVIIPSATLYDVFWDLSERVRGYRDFVSGNRMAFASAEIRLPLLPSLGTSILGGLFSIDQVVFSPFVDAGAVWGVTGATNNGLVHRVGSGAELKNQISVFGLPIIQAIGVGQPIEVLGSSKQRDVYYRIRTSIVF